MSKDDKESESQIDALNQLEILRKEKEDLLLLIKSNSIQEVVKSRKLNESNKLKSDLKKTTAFVKKIRSINYEGLQQCIRDTETLNLTLYISEISSAICETNYKVREHIIPLIYIILYVLYYI